MNTLVDVLGMTLKVLVFSILATFAFGLMFGGVTKAGKWVTWELTMLTMSVRWILKIIFQSIAEIFSYLAHCCGGKQKKKTA